MKHTKLHLLCWLIAFFIAVCWLMQADPDTRFAFRKVKPREPQHASLMRCYPISEGEQE